MPFIDFEPAEAHCNHPEHNPPGLVVLKPGRHVWECPGCGERTVCNVPLITC
jgi:hypothetical protein